MEYISPPAITEIAFNSREGDHSYGFFLGITGPAGREAAAAQYMYQISNLPQTLTEVDSMTLQWPAETAEIEYSVYALLPGQEMRIGRMGTTKNGQLLYAGEDIEILQGDKLQLWLEEIYQLLPLPGVTSPPIWFNTHP